jgi:hypothetical protein
VKPVKSTVTGAAGLFGETMWPVMQKSCRTRQTFVFFFVSDPQHCDVPSIHEARNRRKRIRMPSFLNMLLQNEGPRCVVWRGNGETLGKRKARMSVCIVTMTSMRMLIHHLRDASGERTLMRGAVPTADHFAVFRTNDRWSQQTN